MYVQRSTLPNEVLTAFPNEKVEEVVDTEIRI